MSEQQMSEQQMSEGLSAARLERMRETGGK